MTEVCVIVERLDCGDFSAAVGTRGYHLFFQSARPHESAAQAGAVQTLIVHPKLFTDGEEKRSQLLRSQR